MILAPDRPVTTFQQLRSLVAGLTYKPGWKIEVVPAGLDGLEDHLLDRVDFRLGEEFRNVMLIVQYQAKSATGVLLRFRTVELPIWAWSTVQAFLFQLRDAIAKLESEERDQWLRMDGARLFQDTQ